MTLPERLYTCPAATQSSQLRATACDADVRFNSDGGTRKPHLTVPVPPRFTSGNGDRCTLAHCALSSRNPAGHLAFIEIP